MISTNYGVGDGSTTFNLPDLRGRVSVGADGTQTEFNAVGKTGGAKTVTLTAAESGVSAHTHTTPAHAHGTPTLSFGNTLGTTTTSPANSFAQGPASGRFSATAQNALITANDGGSTSGAATDAAASAGHNNLQPYIAFNHIIKT